MLEIIRRNEENDEIQKGPYHLTAPKIETPLDMFFPSRCTSIKSS